MNYIIEHNTIKVVLPTKNKGKFRFKNRIGLDEFGQTHATTTKPYEKGTYLEWQVGYDVKKTDINKKPTKLTHLEFIGANHSLKHPYELSELLYASLKLNLITKEEILNLKNEITTFTNFFEDDFQINVLTLKEYNYNGYTFARGDITLPSFFFTKSADMTIEVSIQKQQYASSVQPMVYISIPVKSFEENAIGQMGDDFDSFSYIINKGNVKFLLDTFIIFGMCSFRHNKDIINILNVIYNDLF